MKRIIAGVALGTLCSFPVFADNDAASVCAKEATDVGIVDEAEFKEYVADCIEEILSSQGATLDEAPMGDENAMPSHDSGDHE